MNKPRSIRLTLGHAASLVLAATLLLLPASALAQADGPFASMQQGNIGGIGTLSVETGLNVGESATYTVFLTNLPSGVTGAEFICSYDENLVDVSNVVAVNLPGQDVGLFGADAISTTQGPASGSFTFAIASMPPATAGATGGVFSLDIDATDAGEFDFTCATRIAKGTVLTVIPFTPLTITIGAPATEGTVNGNLLPFTSVLAGSKTVYINLTDGGSVDLDDSVDMRNGGNFSFTVAPGTYTIEASAAGYLRAVNASITVVAGDTVSMANLTLLAGDINADDDIDVLDVATIGANYNLTTPAAADLNGSGRINLLDLQMLAPNYGISGATSWGVLP